ncbi:GDSL esterase/lipase 2 [Vitis vinifera]|uniref:GDSL esterase/lipase 2 n=1 Tax=Vitis vinifera TaxID=29760 RepID=A0A438K731_VITVI|nr:GDSL esterase/lipase 2 [Vitis vinifera]
MKEIKLQQGGTGECMEEATELAKLHNIALSKALQKLEIKLKGLKFSISNFQFLLSLRKEWTSLQNMEGKKACCGWDPYRGLLSCGGKRTIKEYELCSNVSKYVFFDSAHSTDKANQQMAELMWKGTGNVTGPYNLEALFGHNQE